MIISLAEETPFAPLAPASTSPAGAPCAYTKLVWLSDIHLDFLDPAQRTTFYRRLNAIQFDYLLITGDIATSHELIPALSELSEALRRPIGFVLGNHDFYDSSFYAVRAALERTLADHPNLNWLSQGSGYLALNHDVALMGLDSWADGRAGDYENSAIILNDHLRIDDMKHLGKYERLQLMQQLADDAETGLRRNLPKLLPHFKTILLATHVPLFAASCHGAGDTISDNAYLPHFCWQNGGLALQEEVAECPSGGHVIALCGHTHQHAQLDISGRIQIRVSKATYGAPSIHVLDLTKPTIPQFTLLES